MKETQPQVLESTSQWPQKILALAPNLNRALESQGILIARPLNHITPPFLSLFFISILIA
jgi:hypothetical protein